jgi:hypothetical protein
MYAVSLFDKKKKEFNQNAECLLKRSCMKLVLGLTILIKNASRVCREDRLKVPCFKYKICCFQEEISHHEHIIF